MEIQQQAPNSTLKANDRVQRDIVVKTGREIKGDKKFLLVPQTCVNFNKNPKPSLSSRPTKMIVDANSSFENLRNEYPKNVNQSYMTEIPH